MPKPRLPSRIEKGAVGGPGFQTTIVVASSGHEQRIVEWDEARGRWDVGYGIRDGADVMEVVAHHRACFGRAYPFLFKDWSDYQAADELIGIGDGSTAVFQLIKTYNAYDDDGAIARSYERDITAPKLSTVVIEVDGEVVSSDTYTVSEVGVVTFDSPPVSSGVITWTGEFDVVVRFDIDQLPVTTEIRTSDQFVAGLRGIPVVELLDE